MDTNDWTEMESQGQILNSSIKPTTGHLSKESSGFVDELQEFQGPKNDKDDKEGETLSDTSYRHAFLYAVKNTQKGHRILRAVQSSVCSVQEKFIHVTYNGETAHLNVGGCVDPDDLLGVIREKLNVKQPIKRIYSLYNGKKSTETEVSGLQANGDYYVETDEHRASNFTTMEEFFDKLKTDEDMSEAQVSLARDALIGQGMTYKQLTKTGDLGMTDEKLKEYGIGQGGLRIAILSIIRGNNQ